MAIRFTPLTEETQDKKVKPISFTPIQPEVTTKPQISFTPLETATQQPEERTRQPFSDTSYVQRTQADIPTQGQGQGILQRGAEFLTGQLRKPEVLSMGLSAGLEQSKDILDMKTRIFAPVREKVKSFLGVEEAKQMTGRAIGKATELVLPGFLPGIQQRVAEAQTVMADKFLDMVTEPETWAYIASANLFRAGMGGLANMMIPKPAIDQAQQILKVGKFANNQEITKAYRRMALQGKYRHPDRGGSNEMFSELTNAYDTLLQRSALDNVTKKVARPFADFFKKTKGKPVQNATKAELEQALVEYSGVKIPQAIPTAVPQAATQAMGFDELKSSVNMIKSEELWNKALTTKGSTVQHKDGWTGEVMIPAKDPVSGDFVVVKNEEHPGGIGISPFQLSPSAEIIDFAPQAQPIMPKSAISQKPSVPAVEALPSITKKEFGTFNEVDISKKTEQPYVSRFAEEFEGKMSERGITYGTLEKMGMLDSMLTRAGHKGIDKTADFKGIYSLDKIIDNPVLFEKYPSLKEVNVVFADFHTPKKRGMRVGNDIYINSKLYAKDKNLLQSTIVHEIQHIKQDIRGMEEIEDEVVRDAKKEFAKQYEGKREIDARRKQDEYLESVKAKETQATPEKPALPKPSEAKPDLATEVLKYDSAEEFVKGQDEYLYHNSSQRFFDDIKEQGLLIPEEGGYPHGIKEIPDDVPRLYMAKDKKRALEFGGLVSGKYHETRSLLLRVKKSGIEGNVYEPSTLSGGETWIFDKGIKPELIEYYDRDSDLWKPISGKLKIKTAADLTTIWQEAHKGVKAEVKDEYKYHTTKKETLRSIIESGLKNGSYLSPNEAMAEKWKPTKGDIVIRINKKNVLSTDTYEGMSKTEDVISPSQIEIKTDDGWTPLLSSKMELSPAYFGTQRIPVDTEKGLFYIERVPREGWKGGENIYLINNIGYPVSRYSKNGDRVRFTPKTKTKKGLIEEVEKYIMQTEYEAPKEVKAEVKPESVTMTRVQAQQAATKEIVEFTENIDKKYDALLDKALNQSEQYKIMEKRNTEFQKGIEKIGNNWENRISESIETQKVMPEVKPEVTEVTELSELPETIKSNIETTTSVFDEIATNSEGKMLVPSLTPFKEALNAVHDWLFTFGEVKRINPALYNRLMASYGRRNAGIERAISKVDNIMNGKSISKEDDIKLALIYEDKRLSPPRELRETYMQFKRLNDAIQRASIQHGILSKPFWERMTEDNNLKIDELKTKLKYPSKSKRIAELVAENDELKNFRYLPHNSVAQRVMERKLEEMNRKDRQSYLDTYKKLSAKYRQRQGRKFLKDYLEDGLLKPEDVGILKMTMDNLASYYYRSSIQSIYNFANQNGLIKPLSDELLKSGWYKPAEIGVSGIELKGKAIHPVLAEALKEMKEMKQGRRGLMGNVLGAVKVAQFVKPQIIFTYDLYQKIFRGAYNNPIKEGKYLAQSFKSVLSKDNEYHKWNELNLFQFPYEITKAGIDEQIKIATRHALKEIPNWVKVLESATGTSFAKGDISMQDALFAAYRAISNVTWVGDKVVRMTSAKALEDMGYSAEESAKIAANAHAAYSVLSEKFKKTMSPIFFVHSFRVLMPIEMAKVAVEPLVGILKTMWKGDAEKVPNADWERWAKAILGTIAIPVAVDIYMKARGFERDVPKRKTLVQKAVYNIVSGFGLTNWKWRKNIVNAYGKKEEVVVGINYILNMPIKYWQRMAQINPITPGSKLIKGVENIARWELHPIWRIMFWDLRDNRRSFGHGEKVYNDKEPESVQIAQALTYAFGQSFRLYGMGIEAADMGTTSKKERNENKIVMKQALSELDRALINTFGYAYRRKQLPERQRIMGQRLQMEYSRTIRDINNKYDGAKKQRMLKAAQNWREICIDYIRNDMR